VKNKREKATKKQIQMMLIFKYQKLCHWKLGVKICARGLTARLEKLQAVAGPSSLELRRPCLFHWKTTIL
jgi:hypothetical protein